MSKSKNKGVPFYKAGVPLFGDYSVQALKDGKWQVVETASNFVEACLLNEKAKGQTFVFCGKKLRSIDLDFFKENAKRDLTTATKGPLVIVDANHWCVYKRTWCRNGWASVVYTLSSLGCLEEKAVGDDDHYTITEDGRKLLEWMNGTKLMKVSK